MIQRRDFVTYLLLSIITCGVYSYYFIYTTTNDLNRMAGDDGKTVNSTAAVLLSIFFGIIYPTWWFYRMGGRMHHLGQQNAIPIDEDASSYVMWMIVGYLTCGIGSLFATFLFIKNFNRIADGYNASMQAASTPLA